MKAATNYDAVHMIIEAVDANNLTGNASKLEEEQDKVRQFWSNLNSIQNSVEGVTGLIYFDGNGDIVKPVTIGKYDNQNLISEFVQLSPVPNIGNFEKEDLDQLVADGQMVILDGDYMRVTNVVYTGIDINEISNLNIKEATYTLDFYIWFRYRGDLDVDELQVANVEFINAVDEITLGEAIATDTITTDNVNYNYQAYRVKGDFTSDFDFKSYPFDTQEIWIRFRHVEKHRDELTYVVDDIGLQRPTKDKLIQRFKDNRVMDITGWEIIDASFFQDIVVSDSTLGNPKFFNTPSEIESSRFNSVITVTRDIVSFSIKNLLPLFIMILFSYLIFFFPASEFSTINGIIRGVLLTVAFFHLKLSSDLPGVDYIVALDFVFYILYFLFVAELIFTLLIKIRGEDEVFIERLFLTGRIAFPLIIIVSGAVLYFVNVSG
jgi:branched-chain amino acid transport system substrate-binding protein